MEYYVVKYTGQFGFIKPWTAVRDGETFSQQFLTPSIIEGMEKKLFPEMLKEQGIKKIMRHRLSYSQMSSQQEQIQPRGWNSKKNSLVRPRAILVRSVLLNPVLHLAFKNRVDAQRAVTQHICLCRNEDLIMPEGIEKITINDFDNNTDRYPGYELIFEKNEHAFLVGYNRYKEGNPMYGWLKVLGTPVKSF